MLALRARVAIAALALAPVLVSSSPALAKSKTAAPAAIAGKDKDPRLLVLDALEQELARRPRLTTEGFDPPYYVSYLLRDVRRLNISGKYGAIYELNDDRGRNLYASVRVGSYDLDSSGEGGFEFNFDPDADYGSLFNYVRAPIDDDTDAIRDAIWLLTDYKYKEALQAYLRKKGKAVYSVARKTPLADFTRESPVQQIGPPVIAKSDRDYWEGIVRSEGAYMKKFPLIFDSGVTCTVQTTTKYFVSSEGSRLVSDEVLYAVSANALTRAEDGQLLEANRTWYAHDFADLPDAKKIHAEVEKMVQEALEQRGAEVIPPYSGPAVLSPRVTGVFFHEAIGHRLEGKRNRSDKEGQTFTDKLGQSILPPFITVTDDPSTKKYGGTDLNGYYLFDDEGVPSRPVTLIAGGILKSFLLSRLPVEGFPNSNGHGRNASFEDPMGRMANLMVKGDKPVSDEKLKEMLIAEAKKQGKPFGIWIEEVSGGETNTQRGDVQAFHGVPTRMFKVDLNTGKMSLVRGAEFIGTPLTVVSKIMATGEHSEVFNGFCGAESGYVPVSTVAPAVLLEELELQRSASEKRKPPLLPPPAFDPGPAKTP
ncbi:MAG TPA: TldD/PmbA family protein [bacterium]|nr:TldD/PmbA family protein [bacterium]